MLTSGGPNEVWSFGEEAYTIIRGLLSLRERLRPYVMRLMREAHETGTPPMRPLFYDFPEDGRAGVWKTSTCSVPTCSWRQCSPRVRAAGGSTCPLAPLGRTPGRTKRSWAASGSRQMPPGAHSRLCAPGEEGADPRRVRGAGAFHGRPHASASAAGWRPGGRCSGMPLLPNDRG
jgi:hypothetical protein